MCFSAAAGAAAGDSNEARLFCKDCKHSSGASFACDESLAKRRHSVSSGKKPKSARKPSHALGKTIDVSLFARIALTSFSRHSLRESSGKDETSQATFDGQSSLSDDMCLSVERFEI